MILLFDEMSIILYQMIYAKKIHLKKSINTRSFIGINGFYVFYCYNTLFATKANI